MELRLVREIGALRASQIERELRLVREMGTLRGDLMDKIGYVRDAIDVHTWRIIVGGISLLITFGGAVLGAMVWIAKNVH